MVKLSLTQPIDFGNLDGWAMSRDVFAWMIDNLNDGDTIVEFGSGTGTIELAKFFTVHAIEHSPHWEMSPRARYIRTTLKSNGWYDPSVMDELPDEYKVAIIDGPVGAQARRGILPHIHKLRSDAYIIIDDVHRKADMQLANEISALLNRTSQVIAGHEKAAMILNPKREGSL